MSLGKLIGAIDEGTSSTRFILFKAGTDEIVCLHQIDVPSIYPQEGWCEQDPMIIYNLTFECIEKCIAKLEKLGGNVEDILAIGVTNQRESTIVWDRATGKPLYNAIIWLDNRTSSTVDLLLQSIPKPTRNINYLKAQCGLPISPYFSAVKLRWLRDNEPVVKKAMDDGTCMFGTVDCWIMYNLTGGASNGGIHITDVTNASRTMLMNIKTIQWDPDILTFFQLPSSILPQIRSSAEVYGAIKEGVLKGKPIAACLGDQQAALVGQQCLQSGQAKTTYGTGCFLLYNTGETIVQSSHGLLTTVGYQLGSKSKPIYALEGSVAIAGVAFAWLRDNLGLFDSVRQVEEMALKVENVMDVYFVPAFSGLYAPYWNQEARGVICGLSEDTTSEHIVRATLESICFQVRDILEAMRMDSGTPLATLMVDGGMTVNHLFLQLQSDLIGINVICSKIFETTALGVALAAYSAVNTDFNIGAPLSASEPRKEFKPKVKDQERNTRYDKWKMAVERSIGWDTSTLPEENHIIFE